MAQVYDIGSLQAFDIITQLAFDTIVSYCSHSYSPENYSPSSCLEENLDTFGTRAAGCIVGCLPCQEKILLS